MAYSSWPSYTQEEASAVQRVLLSNKVNYWTGTEGRKFEKEFSAWVACEYAVAVANGTVALELALKALGVGSGDEVITTPRSFIASASCIVAVGAMPVFADVDANSQNITAASIAQVLTPRTKAIICVHHAGWPCEMDAIMALADEHDLLVIEDCAQAHGARYKGRSVGAWGHIGAWSFCQDKIMTTGGEGGMVTTDSHELWSKMWSFKDHGKAWEAVNEREHTPGFRWLHESFGTNWRMTEMQSAIGRIQLGRMSEWHVARQSNARVLMEAMLEYPALRVPDIPDFVEHAWYKAYVFVRPGGLNTGWDRDRILTAVNSEGVPCFTGSCPEVYLEKAFEKSGLRPEERLSEAKKLGETSLMFLVHPSLTENEIAETVNVIKSVMNQAAI